MGRVTGHAYPWDVLGDPGFPARVQDLGLTEVTLAAAYHAVRAATPLHPRHRLVTARWSALYRPVRPSAWADHRLVPYRPEWTDHADPFGAATERLRTAGLRVNAWIVLNHNTRLGEEHPDVVVVNCFGDRYPHALCPQQTAVRDYAAALATECVRDVGVDGVTIEAWGQLGIAHGSAHDKTDGAWSPAATRLLSICCCTACRRAWAARGGDPDLIVARLRDALAAPGLADSDAPPERLLGAATAELVLDSRLAGIRTLGAGVLAALAAAAPGAHVSMFCGLDRWSGAPVTALSPSMVDSVGTVLLGTWDTGPRSAAGIAAMRAAVPPSTAVGAYVTVLPPARPEALPGHVDQLVAAGATDFAVYHLGLAGTHRQRALAGVIRRRGAERGR